MLLVDTQVLIWLLEGDKRLGRKAQALLQEGSNHLLASYFSLFEMAIKAGIGKLNYDDSIVDDLPKMGIELLMPGREELQTYRIHSAHNRDPFDNMLMSIACLRRCRFVTSDERILSGKIRGLEIVDAAK